MTRPTSRLERRSNMHARTAGAADDHPLAAISPKRIGLFGLFGSGNSGNDGSLEAMVVFLRQVRPDAELTCICSARCGALDYVTRVFRVATVPLGFRRPANVLLRILDNLSLKAPRQLASLVRAIAQARRLDVLIIPGTGILDDFGEGPFGMPVTLFGWCLAARLWGTRIAFVSIGAGPIHHPVSRWFMKSAVAMAQYRSYRDTISKAFMESIGFDTRNDAVYPDIAFKLPAPASPVRQDADERSLIVGVGVMTYLGWRNDSALGAAIYAAYLEKIVNLVLWLLDQGHRVRILMGAAVDRRAVADVLMKVEVARPHLPQDLLLAGPVRSLHDLMDQIAETDVVVATRFHNVVCALRMGKPTISIGYAEKNDALLAEMGLADYCQSIEQLDVARLERQTLRLIADRPALEAQVRRAGDRFQRRLREQEDLLASLILGGEAVAIDCADLLDARDPAT